MRCLSNSLMELRALPLLLLGLALRASACSHFLYSCPSISGGPVSGRTMDFMPEARLNFSIDVTPPHHAFTPQPPCPDCSPPSLGKSKFAIAGLTSLHGSLMSDGMNSEGLSAGYLWLDATPFQLNYRQERALARWLGSGRDARPPHPARTTCRRYAAAASATPAVRRPRPNHTCPTLHLPPAAPLDPTWHWPGWIWSHTCWAASAQ